jgi:spermidine synthase
MPYRERFVLPDGLFTVAFHDANHYSLNYQGLVVYENGRRIIRGRSSAYAFRSVEQMRYDFERDVEAL